MPRIRGTRADAQAFVESLKTFNDTLPPEQRAMLGTILDAAQQDETSGYGRRFPLRGEEDETAGYGRRTPRSDEGPEQGKEERWGRLVEWLGASEGGEDETEGFSIRKL